MTSETVISNRYTHTAVIALLAAFMSALSACGEPPTGGSDAAAATPAADADEVLVEIDFDEYVVLMDAVVPAGPVILKLANKGFEEHKPLVRCGPIRLNGLGDRKPPEPRGEANSDA